MSVVAVPVDVRLACRNFNKVKDNPIDHCNVFSGLTLIEVLLTKGLLQWTFVLTCNSTVMLI